jgi:mono/diheme cytochrome c family protein
MHARPLLLACLGLAVAFPASAAEPKSSPVDFVRDVQPLLAKHCVGCHGSKKEESSLRLDSYAAVMTGGASGPTVVAGKSADSYLIQVVRGTGDLSPMPPTGKTKLTAAEIDVLARWVDAGAKGPAGAAIVTGPPTANMPTKTDHWSFQPIKKPTLPPVKNGAWVRNPIDRFVLAKIEAAGLAPSAEAPRETLLRRVSLDLTGLLPTPAELEAFVYDNAPDAYEKAVDRLLASPHYGERWGRHWLDAARYADSNGYTIDSGRSVWRYRDWVIDALNANMPFDEFTIAQMAGDMLPNPTPEQLIATGFHRNTLVNEEGGTDKEQFRVEAVVDRVSTTGTIWLGLSVGCARCHDHKYDPISQRDFYQLFALLNNCEEPSLAFSTKYQSKEEPALLAEIETFKKRLDDVLAISPDRRRDWERTVRKEISELEKTQKSPEVIDVLRDFTTALDTPEDKRTDEQKKLIEEKFLPNDVERVVLEPQLRDLEKKLKKLREKQTTTLIVREMAKPRESFIHIRGDFLRRGADVEPNTPASLPKLKPSGERATRLDLARWLVSAENPLTPRVTVNRVWQQYFGTGFVATENDFGTQGERPTHPELLDWLSRELLEKKWSLKALHRLIVTSATYRQASVVRPELAAKDPYNKLLARQARVRLEAEVIRDVALAASGLLSPEVGGPSVYPPQPMGIYAFTQQKKFWPEMTGGDRYRRGLYTYFWRSSPYPFLVTFDAPDANAACTRRVRSNTPLQALTLANDRAFVEMAQALGARILKEASPNDEDRTTLAFRLCFGREPRSPERERLLKFVTAQRKAFAADAKPQARSKPGESKTLLPTADELAWTAAARVLLNLDEFITRE